MVLGFTVILCGAMPSVVQWGRRDAPAPLGQELGFLRERSVWCRLSPVILNLRHV